MVLLAQEDAAGVGEARLGRREFRAQAVELLTLGLVLGAVWIVGAGEMAHHEAHREGCQQIGRGGQCLDIRFGHAQAVDAGIDVNGGWQAAVDVTAECAPVADLGETGEHRSQVETRVEVLRAGHQTIEHIDRGTGLHEAGAAPLVEGGDEECPAALTRQRVCDFLEAEPIGVGLDHAGTFSRAGFRVEAGPVGAQRMKIDAQHRAGIRRDDRVVR